MAAEYTCLEAKSEEEGHEQGQAGKERGGGVPVQLVQQAPTHPSVGHWQHHQSVQGQNTGRSAPAGTDSTRQMRVNCQLFRVPYGCISAVY